ncbi:hypothetical protein CMI38_05010 [Candidatus Pacearchaeota archaeon]|jgi:predicted GH43/DUF377 family glycosyl hydrolase|nr:hypothetical protein [Candidatus Pacearchaeota archaeon]|tara:strand:- start:19963 stop:21036 length:1074 start_codon:yes stop_codon:yes gene_type:complete
MLSIKKEGVLVSSEDFEPSTRGFEVVGAFNPGVAELKNGKIVLYVRIAEKPVKIWRENEISAPRFVSNKKFRLKLDKFRRNELRSIHSPYGFHHKDGRVRLVNISHLRRVFLDKSGFSVEKIEQKPAFYGTVDDGELGIEDPCITRMGNKYIMTYVALSRSNGISTSYAVSNDGIKWHKRGIIFRHQNKDVVLFPEKVRGRYVAFNRPEGNLNFSLPHMWISYSRDLEYWGDDETVLLSQRGWDSIRAGAGAAPIKTKKGWLEFYHGVRKTKHEKQYCVGVALFDLKNPSKLIAKSHEPFIVPTMKEEKKGFVHDVVFPTGAILNKKSILLYSGGADRVVICREIELEEIFKYLKKR